MPMECIFRAPSIFGVLLLKCAVLIGLTLAQGTLGEVAQHGGSQAVVLEALVSSIESMKQQLHEVLQEQRELKKHLEACGCKAGSTNGEQPHRNIAEDDGKVGPGLNTRPEAVPELDHVVTIDVGNIEWVKEVFFGGEPWIVHCIDAKDGKHPNQQVLTVFQEAAVELKSLANFGVIDCWQRTASGKTLAHRFNLPKPPVAFAVANGDPPEVVDIEGVTKPWQLRRKLQSTLQATVTRIDGPKSFKALCTSRRACLVVGFKTANALSGAMQVLSPLLAKQRGVRAVAVDTSVWKVQLDKSLTATKPKKTGNRTEKAEILCIARRSSGSAWSGAFMRAHEEMLATNVVAPFLERCHKGSKNLLAISSAPRIELRPPEQPKYHSAGRTGRSPTSSPRPNSRQSGQSKQKLRSSIRPSRKDDRSNARRDHVGSRDKLEQQDEPVFSVSDEEAEHYEDTLRSDQDDLLDEGADEVEL